MADPLDISPQDRDLMIRTVMGEDPTPDGRLGVANVIANRLSSGRYGDSIPSVVLARGQFEPWATRRKELMGYSPNSPDYQQAAGIVDQVLSGTAQDNTGGATHFLNRDIVAQRPGGIAGNAPWTGARPALTTIGAQTYYAPEGTVQRPSTVDPFSDYPTTAPAPAATANAGGDNEKPDPNVPAGFTGLVVRLDKPQAKAAVPDPFSEYPTTPAPAAQAGAKYAYGPTTYVPQDVDVGLAKMIQQADPNTWGGTAERFAGGAVRGIGDVADTLAQGIAATGVGGANALARAGIISPETAQGVADWRNTVNQRIDAGNALYTDAAGSAPFSAPNIGRVGGQILATAPVLGPASSAGANALRALPAAVRATTLGTGIGAGASLLTSASSDQPLSDQVAIGGITGLALGPFGYAAGKVFNPLVSAVTDAARNITPAARNVLGVLQDIGMSPQDARNALARMGPQATLADIDPALTTEAAGLARTGGAPTSVLKGAMAARAAGADDRVAQSISQALGPRPDVTAAKEAIFDQAQKAADPYYTAARASAGPMDVMPILSDIDARLKSAPAGSGEAAVLNKAKGYLIDAKSGMPGVAVPKDDPQALLKARRALDDDIASLQRNGTIDSTSAGRTAYQAANDIRGRLDAVLKADPNIAAGDAAFARQMQNKDAMNEGAELFTKGTRLPDFLRSLAGKTPEQVDALRQGALGAVWDALDSARKGTLSGAQSMFARASANRAKLDALFPNSGDVFDMLNGEAAMRATEQRVAQNSVTAEAQAVQQKYAPKASSDISAAFPLVGQALGGEAGAAAAFVGKGAYSKAKNALADAALNRLKTGTARGLSATGAAQNAFLDMLDRASATPFNGGQITNALAGIAPLVARPALTNR